MKMTDYNNHAVNYGGSHHEHVRVAVSEGAEVGHGVFNERSKDEAEADSQVNIDGLNEAVGVGQRRPGSHHQRGHGQHCCHS